MLKTTGRLAVVLVAIAAGMAALPTFAFQGILNGPGAFNISGTWTVTGVTGAFAWDVVQDTAGFYTYNYRLVVPDEAAPVNMFILQTSDSVTAADIFGAVANPVIGDFAMADYPNLPRDCHGIAWFDVNGRRTSFSFKSYLAPIWGNFYIQSVEEEPSTASNSGFTNPSTDPPDPPSDGSLSYHILTVGPSAPIPDASTILLACFGALQLLAIRKKVFR